MGWIGRTGVKDIGFGGLTILSLIFVVENCPLSVRTLFSVKKGWGAHSRLGSSCCHKRRSLSISGSCSQMQRGWRLYLSGKTGWCSVCRVIRSTGRSCWFTDRSAFLLSLGHEPWVMTPLASITEEGLTDCQAWGLIRVALCTSIPCLIPSFACIFKKNNNNNNVAVMWLHTLPEIVDDQVESGFRDHINQRRQYLQCTLPTTKHHLQYTGIQSVEV